MKVHLASFHYPLIEGRTIKAWCGREIRNAKFAYIWDDVPTGSAELMNEIGALNTCRKCYFEAVDEQVSGYVYGIVPGEELKAAEAQG